MRRSDTLRRQSGGYTLIELLVVIAIIVLLIGLLLPAIQKVRGKGPELATRNEIGQIEVAIEGFKSTYDVKYLPSAWILASDYNPSGSFNAAQNLALADSRQYYSKVWPKAFRPGLPGITMTPSDTAYVTFDGNQALLFLLGGVSPPTAGGPPNGFPNSWQGNRTGFHSLYTNPFGVNAPAFSLASPPGSGGVAKGPFFDFDAKRIDANGHYHDPHWHPTDPVGQNIYYYFSAKEGNDYNFFGRYQPFFNPAMTPGGFMPTGGYGGVDPFIGPDGKFLKAHGYQIISAGADGQAGPGGTTWVPGQTPYVYGVRPGGGDDQSNFRPNVLGGKE